MNYEQETLKEKTVLTLSGELTIPFAEKLRVVLSEMVNRTDRVAVRFKEVTEADLSLLQLLCSFHRSAVRRGSRVAIEGARPEVLTGLMKAAGFLRHRGCRLSRDAGDCLWIEGERTDG